MPRNPTGRGLGTCIMVSGGNGATRKCGMRPGPPHNPLGHLRRQFPTPLTSSVRGLVARTPATAALAGAAALASLSAYAYWIEPFWLDVTRTTIELPGLPPSLD